MQRPPYPPKEPIFGGGMGRDIAWIGLLMAAVCLSMGYWYWKLDSTSDSQWRTIIFTTLTLAQMGNALAIRSNRDSLFAIGPFSNRLLIGSVVLTFGLQLAVIYLPPLQAIFRTVPLSIAELSICILISTIVFWSIELQKLLMRLRR